MIESVAQVRKRGHEHSAVKDLFPLRTISEESRDSATSLIAFIKEYYAYLNQERGPSRVLQDLNDQNDVDAVGEGFLDSIQSEIAKLIPTTSGRDRRTLYKRIVHFYRSKGTPESVNTFFRLFFPDYELPEVRIDPVDPWSYKVLHQTLSINLWHNAFRQLVHPAGLNFSAIIEVLAVYTDADREDSDSLIPRYLAESFVLYGRSVAAAAEWDRGRGLPMLNGHTESRTDLLLHYPLYGEYVSAAGLQPPDRYWNIQWIDSDGPGGIATANARIVYDVSGNNYHGAMHDTLNTNTFYIGADGVPWMDGAEGIRTPLGINDFRLDDSDRLNHATAYESDLGDVYEEAFNDLGGDGNPLILPTDTNWTIAFWYKGTGATDTSDALLDNFAPLIGENGNGAGNLYDADDSGYYFGLYPFYNAGALGILADDEAPGEGKLTYNFNSETGTNPQLKSTTSIDDDRWHHCAMVNHADETVDLFVDGVKEVDGAAHNLDILQGNTRAYFVAHYLMATSWNIFDSDPGQAIAQDEQNETTTGSIVDYRVYGGDLTTAEILELYRPNNTRHAIDITRNFGSKATNDEYLAYGSRQRHPLVQNKWVNETKFTDLASIGTFSNVIISDADLKYKSRKDVTTATGDRRNFLRNWNASATITNSLDSDSDGTTELTGYNTRRDRNVLDVRITSAQFSTFSPGEPFTYQIRTSYPAHEIASYSFSAIDTTEYEAEITSKLSFDTATGKLSTNKWNLVKAVADGSLTEEERQAYKAVFDGTEPDATGTTYKLIDDAINFTVHVKATNGRRASLSVRVINSLLAPQIRSISIINGTGLHSERNTDATDFGFAKPGWVGGNYGDIHKSTYGQYASVQGWNSKTQQSADNTTYDFYTWDGTAATFSGDYPVSAYALQGSDRASFPYNFVPHGLYGGGDWGKSITEAEWNVWGQTQTANQKYSDFHWVSGTIASGIPYSNAVSGEGLVGQTATGQLLTNHHVILSRPGTTLLPESAWETISNIEDKSNLRYQQVAKTYKGNSPAKVYDAKVASGKLHSVSGNNLNLPSKPTPVFGQNSHLEFVVNTRTGVEDANDLGSKEKVTVESIGIWTGDASPGDNPEFPDFSGEGGSYIPASIFGSESVYPFNSIENGEISMKPKVVAAPRATGTVRERTYSIFGERFIAAGAPVKAVEDVGDIVAPAYHGVTLYGRGGVKAPTNLAGETNKFPIPKSRQYRERVGGQNEALGTSVPGYHQGVYRPLVGVFVSDKFTTHDGLNVNPPELDGSNAAWYQWVNKTRFPNKATSEKRGITYADGHFEGLLTSTDLGSVNEVRNYYNIPTTAGGSITEFTPATAATAATVLNGLAGSGAVTSYEGWKITVANEFGAVSKNVFLKYDPTVTAGPVAGNPFQSFLPGDGTPLSSELTSLIPAERKEVPFQTITEISDGFKI